MIDLSQVQVVLSHPSEPRNIGSACRAMKNHALHDLVIVAEGKIDVETARPLALHAADILSSAHVVDSLEAAVAHSALVAGVTRRAGQKRKSVTFSARQFASLPVLRSGGRISVVFGNEQSGLSDEELAFCDAAVFIPSDDDFPSLNLSHAVQIVAYELYVADAPNGVRNPHEPLDRTALTASVGRLVDSLEALGYHTQEGPQGMRLFLRDLLARAAMMPREAARLERLFRTLEGMYASGP